MRRAGHFPPFLTCKFKTCFSSALRDLLTNIENNLSIWSILLGFAELISYLCYYLIIYIYIYNNHRLILSTSNFMGTLLGVSYYTICLTLISYDVFTIRNHRIFFTIGIFKLPKLDMLA